MKFYFQTSEKTEMKLFDGYILPHSQLVTLWEKVMKLLLYIYVCVQTAKCPHQVAVSWSYYCKKMTDMIFFFFFFLCYRYKINEVLQSGTKPITWRVGLKYFPIKLPNACVNILFYLNNQIMDWISIGQWLACWFGTFFFAHEVNS